MKALIFAAAAFGGFVFPSQAQTGIVSGNGFGPDQGTACASAKDDAKAAATLDGMRTGKSNAHVVSFGACQCNPPPPSQDREISTGWRCAVQASYSTD